MTRKIHALVKNKKQFQEDMINEKLFGSRDFGYLILLSKGSQLDEKGKVLKIEEKAKVILENKIYIVQFSDDKTWGTMFGPARYYQENPGYFLSDVESTLKGSCETYTVLADTDIPQRGKIIVILGSVFTGKEHLKTDEIVDSKWVSKDDIYELAKDKNKSDISMELLSSVIKSFEQYV